MSTRSPSSAVYVYGLVRSSLELDLGSIGIVEAGVNSPVFTLPSGRIAAVVSPRKDRGAVLPARRDLDAHHRVTSRVLEAGTILPFAFGQVARNERAVMTLIRAHEDAVAGELDRLEGKVQMGLKVHWDVDNIYQHIIAGDAELAALARRIFAAANPGMADKIELGERFHDALVTRRAALVDALTAALPSSLAPPQQLPARGEKTIADLMFLIERRDRMKFDDEVRHLADTWPAEVAFRMTGPWAPFNFVELELPGSGNGRGEAWAL